MMVKCKVIRSAPDLPKIGAEIELPESEAKLRIRQGKVIPAEDVKPGPLANKAVKEVQTRGGGRGT